MGNGKNEGINPRLKPLIKYFKEHGTIADIRQKHEVIIDGVRVNFLVTALRRDKRNGNLNQETIDLLDYMGMIWEPQNPFEKNKKILWAWIKQNGSLENLTQYSTMEYDGELVDIGDILINLRKGYKKGVLTEAQIEFLEMNGVVFAPKSAEVAFASLIDYAKNVEPLSKVKCGTTYFYEDKTYNIGRQVRHLRTRYKEGKLKPADVKLFESLGMVWSLVERKDKKKEQEMEV